MTQSTEEGLDIVRQELTPFVNALEADGYHLGVESIADRVLAVRVEASAEACEECLVPKGIMAAILKDALSGAVVIDSVRITYPAELAK